MRERTQIIKLDATDSTNVYLKAMIRSKKVENHTVVVAKKQLNGKGQMGAIWHTEAGKNLTFSVLKKFESLHTTHQFTLNICVSLAIYDVLNELSIPDVSVKWPNDIMSGSFKICGILIENALKGSLVQHSIIGIGLNVNQTSFENLEKAGSLKSVSGRNFDLDGLLHKILERMEHHLQGIDEKTVTQLLPSYERILFRKDKPSTFTDVNGDRFMGFIRKVSSTGKLVLELEDQAFREFDLKEVSLLY